MAPSNLSQVFVVNSTTPFITSTTFSNTAASGLAANSKAGIWNVAGKTNLTGASAATALMTSAGVLNPALKQIQFTQTMLSGNCIASPIIDAKDIKRLAITKYKAATPYTVVAAIGSEMAADDTTKDQPVMMRFAIRTAPISYASFANPNDATLDISSDTTKYAFPLQGNFSAGRNIHSIEISEVLHEDDEATFATEAAAAINAHPYLKKVFYATASSTDLTVEARHEGVVFDLTIQYSDGTILAETQSITGNAGVGNYYQVLSDEKSHRSKYGNFNRMYFPMDFPTFATAGTNYDVIDISYAHAHPASTGIARAAELNNLRIYLVSQEYDDTNQNADTVLAYNDTDVRAAFGANASVATPGLVTEWYF